MSNQEYSERPDDERHDVHVVFHADQADGHRMKLQQRTWPRHQNDDCGVAMQSAIPE